MSVTCSIAWIGRVGEGSWMRYQPAGRRSGSSVHRTPSVAWRRASRDMTWVRPPVGTRSAAESLVQRG